MPSCGDAQHRFHDLHTPCGDALWMHSTALTMTGPRACGDAHSGRSHPSVWMHTVAVLTPLCGCTLWPFSPLCVDAHCGRSRNDYTPLWGCTADCFHNVYYIQIYIHELPSSSVSTTVRATTIGACHRRSKITSFAENEILLTNLDLQRTSRQAPTFVHPTRLLVFSPKYSIFIDFN